MFQVWIQREKAERNAKTLACVACGGGRMFDAQGLLQHTRAKHGNAAADALRRQRASLPSAHAAGAAQAAAGAAVAALAPAAAAAAPSNCLPAA